MAYPSTLIPWIDALESRGRTAFELTEALAATGLSRGAFLDAAERLQKKGRLLRPRQGFYVPVPAADRKVGEPFLTDYFKEWMDFEGCEYYVAFMSAAAWHGASHQAAMTFQVVAGKRIPSGAIGRRTYVQFTFRRDFGPIRPFIADRKRRIGERPGGERIFKVSSPELTLLDLVRRPDRSAGLDNLANIAIELPEEIDPGILADCSARFSCPVVQRAGYLLDRFGHRRCAAALKKALSGRGASRRGASWAELEPPLAQPAYRGRFPAVERNSCWKIIVREPPDPDVHPDLVDAN